MIRILSSLLLLLVCIPSYAQTEISQQLVNKIAKSKQQLASLEEEINRQALAYQQQIDKELRAVKALREQASAIQRVADEQILSVEQLSERVTKWREQDNYQRLLLQSYFEQQGDPIVEFIDENGDLVVSDNVFLKMQSSLVDSLVPRWQPAQAVTEDGEVSNFTTLAIGPVTVAYNQELQEGGLIEHTVNQALPNLVSGIYETEAISQLAQLNETGLGQLTFDPSLGNAAKIQNHQQGIMVHIQKGGVWALPILFFGALSFCVALAKAIQLFSLPKVRLDFIERIDNLKETSTLSTASFNGAEKALIDIALAHPVSDKRDDKLVAYLMQYRHKVENYLGVIATSAAIAPLLGLLGTVSGMINTFMMMNTFGTGDAATVSGGISEALVTTELGLIVAIPSLILSALLSRKAKSHNAKLEANAIQLSKHAV